MEDDAEEEEGEEEEAEEEAEEDEEGDDEDEEPATKKAKRGSGGAATGAAATDVRAFAARLKPGTLKHTCFVLLQRAGATGMDTNEMLEAATKEVGTETTMTTSSTS
jgi:hypothetical protein